MTLRMQDNLATLLGSLLRSSIVGLDVLRWMAMLLSVEMFFC
jgi:hypothetical protein